MLSVGHTCGHPGDRRLSDLPSFAVDGDGLGGEIARLRHMELEPGTFLEEILGAQRITVRSSHHQSIKEPGTGLVVSARCARGEIIEAIEREGAFVLGVQWHPEYWAGSDPPSRVLFTAFREAAAETLHPLHKRVVILRALSEEIEASRKAALIGVTDQREIEAINIVKATEKLAAQRETERQITEEQD